MLLQFVAGVADGEEMVGENQNLAQSFTAGYSGKLEAIAVTLNTTGNSALTVQLCAAQWIVA